jgi:hypothetical protein
LSNVSASERGGVEGAVDDGESVDGELKRECGVDAIATGKELTSWDMGERHLRIPAM